MRVWRKIPLELIFWVLALLMLAFANPNQHHFVLCPIANLGFDWCPGCGLGRAISSIFKGDISQSFKHHYLGFPALSIIIYRMYTLINGKALRPIKN